VICETTLLYRSFSVKLHWQIGRNSFEKSVYTSIEICTSEDGEKENNEIFHEHEKFLLLSRDMITFRSYFHILYFLPLTLSKFKVQITYIGPL
jgi:hypothetical protein